MSTQELITFVAKVYRSVNYNYSEVARILGVTAPSVRRVVHGGKNSVAIRRAMSIRKSDRTRVCFDCELEFRDKINEECKRQGITRTELIVDMFDIYYDTMENMPY